MSFCVFPTYHTGHVLSRTFPSAAHAQQSSKNGNKPKKSVGKSLLKKTFPSVSAAIKKQVRDVTGVGVGFGDSSVALVYAFYSVGSVLDRGRKSSSTPG